MNYPMIDAATHRAETELGTIEPKKENPMIQSIRNFVGRVFSKGKKEESKTQNIETLEGEALIAQAMELKNDKVAYDIFLKNVFVKLDAGNLPLLHKLHREIRGIDLEDRDLIAIHDQLKMIGSESDIYSFLKSDSRIIENIDTLRREERADNLATSAKVEQSRILAAYIARFMERQKNPSISYGTDIKINVKNEAKTEESEAEIPMDDPDHKVIPIGKPHPVRTIQSERPEKPDNQVA